MTTIEPVEVLCAECGQQSTHVSWMSTNTMEGPDIDLRPGEMMRSTMHTWVQRCPGCGYCAADISVPTEERALLKTPDYQAILHDGRFSPLAQSFLAQAFLDDERDPAAAAHERLRAAWVCDDLEDDAAARECRLLCAATFQRLKPFADDARGMTQAALLVDALRRAGEFERALKEIDGLAGYASADGFTGRVLELQRELIAAKDSAAHRLAECSEPVEEEG